MINKIIANYLAGGRRLVIPQFGAFIHKEGDGAVVFVPFLKKDDGVLADLLRKEYGLDEADAQGIIAEYVNQIHAGIAERGSFTVEGVGFLRLDANKIVTLDYDPMSGKTATATTASVSSGTSIETVAPTTKFSEASAASAAPISSGKPSVAESVVSPTVSETPVPPASTVKPQAASTLNRGLTPEAGRDVVREAYYGNASAPTQLKAPQSAPAQGTSGAGRPVPPTSPAASVQPQSPVSPVRTQSTYAQPSDPASSQPAFPQSRNQAYVPRSGQPQSVSGATASSMAQSAGRPAARPGTQPMTPPVSPSVPRAAQSGPSSSRPGQSAQYDSPRRPTEGSVPPYGASRRPVGPPPGGSYPAGGGRPPGRPISPRSGKAPENKSGKFLIIAIIAAIIALASIVYGILSSSDGPVIEPIEMQTRPASAPDSTQLETLTPPGPETPAR